MGTDDDLAAAILTVLRSVRSVPRVMASEAARRGVAVESLEAAALVGAVAEWLHGHAGGVSDAAALAAESVRASAGRDFPLAVRLPAATFSRLVARAKAAGRPPEAVVADILARTLGASP